MSKARTFTVGGAKWLASAGGGFAVDDGSGPYDQTAYDQSVCNLVHAHADTLDEIDRLKARIAELEAQVAEGAEIVAELTSMLAGCIHANREGI